MGNERDVAPPDLHGKVVLVTGAGRGIGRALALAFARAGAHVAGCGLEEAELADAQAQAAALQRTSSPESRGGKGARHRFGVSDITDEADFQRFVHEVMGELGPIDVLVANAGVTDVDHHRLVDLPTAVWERVIRVNLTGTFITLKTVLPVMMARRRGNIIVITSLLGQRGHGQANDGPYCASKFGVEGLVEVAAAECADDGVNVNTLFPAAMVDTGFFAHWSAEERRQLSPANVIDEPALFLAALAPGTLTGKSVNGKRWREEAAYRERLVEQAHKQAR